jgi:hypothetical protein
MLLAVQPHGDASLAEVQAADLPYRRRGYAALLDATWGASEPGAGRLQTVARKIAAVFADDPEQLLRDAPAGNMIPFRSESLSRLPDPLRKQGLAIGARLISLVRPRVLVLMGGDRVLFHTAVSALPGRVVDSAEEAFGATRRAYRDATVADGGETTFAAVLPLHALEQGLAILRRRFEARQPMCGVL